MSTTGPRRGFSAGREMNLRNKIREVTPNQVYSNDPQPSDFLKQSSDPRGDHETGDALGVGSLVRTLFPACQFAMRTRLTNDIAFD